MIDENTIKFGYGDVCVGSSSFLQEITFQQIKPPQKCGSSVSQEANFIGNKICFHIDDVFDYNWLINRLDEINAKETKCFIFKNYLFDFVNYNKDSIEVVRKHLNNAMSQYFMMFAC